MDINHDKQNEEKNSSNADVEAILKTIQEKLEVRGNEIDAIQVEMSQKSNWWGNPSNIISVVAILLSVFATTYSILQDGKKETEQAKLRVKEIVMRINEIQSSFINADPQLLAQIQQQAVPELANLLDEAVDISVKNKNSLNDSEYVTLVNTAFLTNKTENIEQLINNGLSIVNDVTTEYALLNSQARFYFEIKKEPQLGRESIKKVIQKTEEQEVGELMKRANIALEYLYWSGFEFSVNNFSAADSTLKIAEDIVINSEDAWKFVDHAIVFQVKQARSYFNQRNFNN